MALKGPYTIVLAWLLHIRETVSEQAKHIPVIPVLIDRT